ncbi:MAG TPA: FAD-dependent oxidoreductase [Candidatus Binataceae bacterium]|nr:FAD-dependent oxidoreductase [Candidatus Binataceae bacterium]
MSTEPKPALTGPGGRPLRMATVERVFDHTEDTRSLFLSPQDGGRINFIPGQFISLSIPLEDETRSRPYSIASAPEAGAPYEICFNRVENGRGAGWLFERAVGDAIGFSGPFGAFALERALAMETVFIAAGTAIAPIRPMIHRAAAGAHPAMTLLHAAPSAGHLLYRAEFEHLARRDTGFRFETIVAPESDLYRLLLEAGERRWVGGDANRARQFYICGVGNGVIALRDLFRGAGYERRAVHYEQW